MIEINLGKVGSMFTMWGHRTFHEIFISRLDNDFFLLKVPPCPNFNKSQGAFSYVGPKIWNDLPYFIRSMSSVDSFKTALKTHYFNIAFKDVD